MSKRTDYFKRGLENSLETRIIPVLFWPFFGQLYKVSDRSESSEKKAISLPKINDNNQSLKTFGNIISTLISSQNNENRI